MYGRMDGWMAMELIVGVFRVGNKSIEFIDLICDIYKNILRLNSSTVQGVHHVVMVRLSEFCQDNHRQLYVLRWQQ